ncbi:MAG: T9SS type A sorting domain-containing protein [bacterium]
MIKIHFIFWISIIITLPVFSQPDAIWTKTFGTEYSDGARTFCIDDDGGFVIAGYTYSNSEKNSDIYIIKTDANGNEIWAKSIGNESWEYANSICKAINSGFVIVGYKLESITNIFDIYIVKIDNNGNILWEKTYGGIGTDIGQSICQTNDNGYLICGNTTSYGAGEDDIYLIKINEVGDSIWTKTIGCNKSDMGYKAISTKDDHYLIVGSTGLYDSPGVSSGHNREIYLVKTDLTGNVVQFKTYWIIGRGQVDYDSGYDVCETSDNCYYITGASSKEATEVMDISILKVDNELTQLWKKRKEIGSFYDYGYSVSEVTEDNGIIICGSFNSADTGLTDAFILRLNSAGDEIWCSEFGEDKSESFYSIKYIGEGNFIAAGYTNSYGAGSNDFWLAKFNDHVTSVKQHENIFPESPTLNQNYPNPFNPQTMISYQLPHNQNVRITIYNGLGQKIRELVNANQQRGEHCIVWDGKNDFNKNMASGVYFYRLITTSSIITKKMIMIR